LGPTLPGGTAAALEGRFRQQALAVVLSDDHKLLRYARAAARPGKLASCSAPGCVGRRCSRRERIGCLGPRHAVQAPKTRGDCPRLFGAVNTLLLRVQPKPPNSASSPIPPGPVPPAPPGGPHPTLLLLTSVRSAVRRGDSCWEHPQAPPPPHQPDGHGQAATSRAPSGTHYHACGGSGGSCSRRRTPRGGCTPCSRSWWPPRQRCFRGLLAFLFPQLPLLEELVVADADVRKGQGMQSVRYELWPEHVLAALQAGTALPPGLKVRRVCGRVRTLLGLGRGGLGGGQGAGCRDVRVGVLYHLFSR
jgi:hypothetical protein